MQSQAGLSLTELLVSVALASSIGLILTTVFSNQSSTISDLRGRYDLQTIAQRVEQAASRPDVIVTSADYYDSMPSQSYKDAHKKLYDCISPTSGTECIATDPKNQVGILLVLPFKET